MKVMDEEEQEDEAVPSKGLTKGEPGRPYTTMIPGKMKSKSKRREEKMERPRSRLIRWAGARNEVEKEKEKDEPEPSTSKGEVLPRSSPIWMSLMTRTSTRISRSNRVRRHHQPKPGLKFKAKSVPPPLLAIIRTKKELSFCRRNLPGRWFRKEQEGRFHQRRRILRVEEADSHLYICVESESRRSRRRFPCPLS